MEKGDNSRPRREKAEEISDDEDDLVIYCAFSHPVIESDEPRPKFDFNKPVLFVDPVRRISPEAEYEEAMAAEEKARARAERRHQRAVAVASGDTSVKLPKVILRRTNHGAPPHKGGQLPRLFPLE